MNDLLEVKNLRIAFPGKDGGSVFPVDGVQLTLGRSETLALVGESGCGKSLTALALLGLVPPPGRIAEGSRILLEGMDVLQLGREALRRVRGRRIGIVFQDAMTSLNPVLSVGTQVREAVTAHRTMSRREARARAVELLGEAEIPDPAARYDAFQIGRAH